MNKILYEVVVSTNEKGFDVETSIVNSLIDGDNIYFINKDCTITKFPSESMDIVMRGGLTNVYPKTRVYTCDKSIILQHIENSKKIILERLEYEKIHVSNLLFICEKDMKGELNEL